MKVGLCFILYYTSVSIIYFSFLKAFTRRSKPRSLWAWGWNVRALSHFCVLSTCLSRSMGGVVGGCWATVRRSCPTGSFLVRSQEDEFSPFQFPHPTVSLRFFFIMIRLYIIANISTNIDQYDKYVPFNHHPDQENKTFPSPQKVPSCPFLVIPVPRGHHCSEVCHPHGLVPLL